jgi:hypothetical protein
VTAEVKRIASCAFPLTRLVSRSRLRAPLTGSAGIQRSRGGSGITQIYEGTNQIQRVVMARQLLK